MQMRNIDPDTYKAALGTYSYPESREIIVTAVKQGIDLKIIGEGTHYPNHVLAVSILLRDEELTNLVLDKCREHKKKCDQQHPVINKVSAWENTALALAIKSADYKLATLLVEEFDADVNQVFGMKGLTPLHFCLGILGTHYQTEHPEKDQALFEFTKLLLEKGAKTDTELLTKTKDSPLDVLKLRMNEYDFCYFNLIGDYAFYKYCQNKYDLSEEHFNTFVKIKGLKNQLKRLNNKPKTSSCWRAWRFFRSYGKVEISFEQDITLLEDQISELEQNIPNLEAIKKLDKKMKVLTRKQIAINNDESLTPREQIAAHTELEKATRNPDHELYEAQMYYDDEDNRTYTAKELIEKFGSIDSIPWYYMKYGKDQREGLTEWLLHTNIMFFRDNPNRSTHELLHKNRNNFFETPLGKKMFMELERRLEVSHDNNITQRHIKPEFIINP